MATHRLQSAMELLAHRKQREHEKQTQWTNTSKYFNDWQRHNNLYSTWTSDDYYETSLNQYLTSEQRKLKENRLQERRQRLKKLLDDETSQYALEVSESPRNRPKVSVENSISTLRDVNIGLKLAEEERRKHEAEMRLYHQWRKDNPIVRDYERNHHRAGLKLAWLDQQIEKRMAEERTEEETRRTLEKHQRLLRERDEIERVEAEACSKRASELSERINENMTAYKETTAKLQALEANFTEGASKQRQLDDLIDRKRRETELRNEKERVLHNLAQAKMKLRVKAAEIEDDIKREQALVDDLERLRIIDELDDAAERKRMREAVNAYLEYVRELRRVEQQRQQFISFVFDSEAKQMWHKQDRVWRDEQATRNRLLDDVLTGLRQQVAQNAQRKLREKSALEDEKSEALRRLEEADCLLKQEADDNERRRRLRRAELEEQIREKDAKDQLEKLEEERRKREELESIQKEEERLRNELLMLQRGKYHPARYTRRTTFW